ncbi:metallophosphoesterase family protein [Nocardioides sp. R1-1]|uniref:metallophosphoesterase family protein n=1 Tax=Nocardioides sp. R1-1 TaxID=3383502 RepID=UPI0038D1695D
MARLLHLSDLHLGADESGTAEMPAARLSAVLEAAAGRGPFDAVVVTGDVCDAGAEDDAMSAQQTLSGVAPLLVVVPGNHDRTDVIHRVFGTAGGPLDGWHIVGVATNIAGEPHGDGRPLADAISAIDPDRPAIVAHHHPVHSRSTHRWFTLTNRQRVMAALEARRSPLMMLSGHTHEPYDRTEGAVRFVGAPSTYYGLLHSGDSWALAEHSTGAVVIDIEPTGRSSVEIIAG